MERERQRERRKEKSKSRAYWSLDGPLSYPDTAESTIFLLIVCSLGCYFGVPSCLNNVRVIRACLELPLAAAGVVSSPSGFTSVARG